MVNFPEKQVGPFMSQVLTLGFMDENDAVVMIEPNKPVPNGARLH